MISIAHLASEDNRLYFDRGLEENGGMGLYFILGLIGVAVLGLAALLFAVLGRTQRLGRELGDKLATQDKSAVLQQQMSDLRSSFTENFLKQMEQIRSQMVNQYKDSVGLMERTNKNWSAQFETSQKAVTDVRTSLTRLEEATKKIFEVGKDISGLNDILRAPKLRGNLGEYFLKDLLDQIMSPEQFQMQYKFKNGQIVDAVIKTADGLVPIDSKFPMESFRRMIETENGADRERLRKEFQRSVKERVKEISENYIRPSEKTLDFALMYIPAENIYYETIIRDDSLGEEGSLSEYATKRHVIPTSPNTLYSYLCTILMGLRGLKIEKEAEEIIRRIQRLNKEFEKFGEHFAKMDDKIFQLRTHYDESQKRLGKIQNQMEQIEGQTENVPAISAEPDGGPLPDKN